VTSYSTPASKTIGPPVGRAPQETAAGAAEGLASGEVLDEAVAAAEAAGDRLGIGVTAATGLPPHATAARSRANIRHNRLDLSPSLNAVILAAGLGTRMRSRTPKVLHPICGRPMIDWVLEAVAEAGAKQVTVIVNPHHAEVAAHLDGRAQIVYQRDPKGTAHALLQIPAGELRGRQVLVVNGDSPLLTAASLLKVVHAAQEGEAPATIASVEDPTRDDGRIIRDSNGALERIVERKDATPDMRAKVHEFNVGLYLFDGSRLVDELGKINADNNAGEFYLTDVFLHLKPVNVVKLDDPKEALGVKDRVRLATATEVMRMRILERCMLAGVTIVDPASTFIDAAVTIGQDTVIEPFTVIRGASAIGAECRVGPHAYIEDASLGDRSDCGPFAKLRPGTQIEEDVHIGSFAELVRTRVGRRSRVPHVSYLGDTDLGADANIGAGTITANFDGTNKNRTEIGDGAFVGVDTMLVAPVKLGKGARTGAGSVVTKDVPDGATAVGVPARVVRRKS
jgi:bifunctional UDP-N-acetylglucosamine pyrophosphorylase/glucosamine-1-phosphate N-acetyltransferase